MQSVLQKLNALSTIEYHADMSRAFLIIIQEVLFSSNFIEDMFGFYTLTSPRLKTAPRVVTAYLMTMAHGGSLEVAKSTMASFVHGPENVPESMTLDNVQIAVVRAFIRGHPMDMLTDDIDGVLNDLKSPSDLDSIFRTEPATKKHVKRAKRDQRAKKREPLRN